jgi:hypothetical protein
MKDISLKDCMSPPAHLNLHSFASEDAPFDLAKSYRDLPQTAEEQMNLIKEAW